MKDSDKKALLDNSATIKTKIEILPLTQGEESIILNEDLGIVNWDYEDFRYVKDEGIIGQFVARELDGTLSGLTDEFNLTDCELNLKLCVKTNTTENWYDLGNFLVTKADYDDVKDTVDFKSMDYTKKFNKTYEDTITYPCTLLQLAQNVCQQCGCQLGNTNFKHATDWTISGNVFTSGETCRDVMKAIGKLAYSWVRVDWDNKVYLDFNKQTQVTSEYNKASNNSYYDLKTQKNNFGPVNRVIIGYKDIEGEKTKVEDATSIARDGLCELTIYDNPLVNTQELREKAIIGAEELLGLEYMPLEMTTLGHAWLKGNELMEVQDMQGNNLYTYPFDRTINYFGHIKTKISSDAKTSLDDTYAYESQLERRVSRAEISVDKQNKTIQAIVRDVEKTATSITTEYYISSSRTELKDGSWVTSVSYIPADKFLWTRTKTTYTDTTKQPTYSQAVVITGNEGAKGDTGPQGPQGVKGDTGAQGPQGVKGDTGAKGDKGDKGDTGEKGRGVKEIVVQYYLSTSNTTQTGGSWSTTQPKWEEGKYIWTRSHITWDDNTTTDTTPILANFDNDIAEKYSELKITTDGITSDVGKLQNNYNYITTTEKTVSGDSNLYIEDSLKENALSRVIDGNSEQETYTGKNLLNYITNLVPSINGLTSTLNADGSITTTGIPTRNYINIVAKHDITNLLDDGQTYTLWNELGNVGNNLRLVVTANREDGSATYYENNSQNKSFTVNKTTYKKYYIGVQTQLTSDWGTSSRTITNKYMLCKGTDTTFEPYVGREPSPSPDYPQSIYNVGVCNLLKDALPEEDSENFWVSYSTFDKATRTLTRSTTATTESYISHIINGLKSGTTYTLTLEAKSNGYVKTMDFYCYAAGVKGIITKQNIQLTNDFKTYTWTFTTASNIDYSKNSVIRFDNNGSKTVGTEAILTIRNVMLKEGKAPNIYVPYGNWLVEKITGKNLFNYVDNLKTSVAGLTNTLNADGSITTTGILTQNYVSITGEIDITDRLWHGETYRISQANYDAGDSFRAIIYVRNLSNVIVSYVIANNGAKTFTVDKSKYTYSIGIQADTTTSWGTSSRTITNKYMLCKGTDTIFEPYKETIVKTSLNKENLFDKDNANIIVGTTDGNGNFNIANQTARTIYIECDENKVYTIFKTAGSYFRVGSYTSIPVNGDHSINCDFSHHTASNITINTGAGAKYLAVTYYSSADTLTEEELRNSIKIYEGTEPFPYYELCKIGDIKDEIDTTTGILTKRIGKVVLDGSENWNIQAEQYFIANQKNTNIQKDINPMFKSNIGNISYGVLDHRTGFGLAYAYGWRINLKDINAYNGGTVAQIKEWLRKNPVTVYYVLATPYQVQLEKTNIPLYENINNITLESNINTNTNIKYLTNTTLNGTYATKTQLKQTAESVKVNVKKEIQAEGVSSVKNTTGTFDENGLTIEQTDSETKTNLNPDGLKIQSATGSSNQDLLVVDHTGMTAENERIKTYLYVGEHCRIQDYDGGVGMFFIE